MSHHVRPMVISLWSMVHCLRDTSISHQVSRVMRYYRKAKLMNIGIFMGLFTMFFLLSIGYVGINALQSLQVSYGAFDKENGPAAQRKQ